MKLKDRIKATVIQRGFTLTDVAKKMLMSRQNLYNKLSKETLRYTEAELIADSIGMEIIWIPKRKSKITLEGQLILDALTGNISMYNSNDSTKKDSDS